jgi:hypothetical protein
MSSIIVIGTVFKKRNEVGDFDWMIRSGKYEDALFIFNDDEFSQQSKRAGGGNAIIRKYNRYALDRPRSAGIVTGSSNGYSSLTENVKQKIDGCFDTIRELCKVYGYTKIYYSASTPNGLLGTSIFVVGADVLDYITTGLHELAN